ncbi:MAG: DUF389 domain-containing protein, partial [Gaiellales bacterium]
IIADLFYEDDRRAPFIRRFLRLTIASAAIAAFGLLTNSAAVVIGAMLVAPLMTPILATAAALVHGQVRRLVEANVLLLTGTVAAIAVGWLLAKIGSGAISEDDLTAQLLARTSPGLLDLGIAVAAGAAAAYILTDRGAGSALPGVAIAVALVPPLATAGITLELGSTSDTRGALLLFSTNFAAIVLSAATVFGLSGFVAGQVRASARRRVRLRGESARRRHDRTRRRRRRLPPASDQPGRRRGRGRQGEQASALNDRPETLQLLAYLATPEAGIPWAEQSGFISPYPQLDTDLFGRDFERRLTDELRALDVIRFDASDLMPPGVGTGSFFEAILQFVRSSDVDEAAQIAESGRPDADRGSG